VAPTVTAPANPPVRVAVKTPEPAALEAEMLESVPPTALPVKAMSPTAGSPVGFRLPNASLVVRVAVTVEPELTVAEERVTTL
jgi:hypothetical protein